MNRRAFLAVSGLTVSVPLAGCLRQSIPDGITVDTGHWVADVLEEGLWYQRQQREESIGRYHQLIADAQSANEQLADHEGIQTFAHGTDFEQSYLLVVQNIMQSARWLELGRIRRMETGLDVGVVTKSPEEPYGDDAAVHSLAIRITDEEAGVPSQLNVTVDGEPTTTG